MVATRVHPEVTMMPGDLVTWKYQIESGLPCEFGIIVEPLSSDHDPWHWRYWKVMFGNRGILHCRENDLIVVNKK